MAKVAYLINDVDTSKGLVFKCPACKGTHQIIVEQGNTQILPWSFNGDMDKPTINPSIKVTYDTTGGNREYIESQFILGVNICHSFITGGKIAYCSDSTHALAGQTVELPEIED